MDCIFCKIAKHEIPANIIFEDDELVVFHDIHPKAPTHLLIIPKQHIESVNGFGEQTRDLAGKLLLCAKEQARKANIAESGYKLVINCGRAAGQIVNHLHVHLLGGKQISGIV